MKKRFEDITTPAVLVEEKVLIRNIKAMQQKAKRKGLDLYPHIKTHKSLYLAALQVKYGAKGLTASKVSEAIPFIKAGFPSIIIAYPLVEQSKILRLLKVAKRHQCQLHLIVDSDVAFQQLSKSLEKVPYLVRLMLKIDVGLNRCGYLPTDLALLTMAEHIMAHPLMELKGLLSHAGHCYAAKTRKAVKQIAREELAQLKVVSKLLVKAGFPKLPFSIGATPTVLARRSFPHAVTSLRPGNYIFMDRTPLRLDLIETNEIALSVLATVISKNQKYWILNVGSKQLSSDAGAHGIRGMQGYGLVYAEDGFLEQTCILIDKLSEEHAFVIREQNVELEIGQRVRIVPNHSCVVMNLAKYWYLVDGENVRKKFKGPKS